MRVAVVSLFPEMISGACGYGICGRALDAGLLELSTVNPREFAHDRHRTVDDRPYGGGPGMVMMVEPLRAAIGAARKAVGGTAKTVHMSPQGVPIDDAAVRRLAAEPALVLVCSRYEGVDERLIELEIDEELSLGDFVLSGGELPALALVDAMARQLPGALGHGESAQQDSFADGLLDWPHYTRPERVEGLEVPPVLLSGHHARIEKWRLHQALVRTAERRPDLLAERSLSEEEQAVLAAHRAGHAANEE
ncbi:MAG: tRNA (guanosine(37)-N1)-methyltransferase TrmD [Pseudomonadota bacterium]